MRKILLGTTAVVGAVLMGPEPVSAQQAPTVRIGGYFRALYGNTQQTSASGNNIPTQVTAGDSLGIAVIPTTSTAIVPVAGGGFVQVPTVGGIGTTAAGGAAGGTGANQITSQGNVPIRNGKNDFSTDAEVHVFVNGKAANGLTYGAVIEIQFDGNEGTARTARRSASSKTAADLDEAYAFIATPALGQVRFGDEDGPVGGLMTTGIVTNFGTGGVYGDFEDFVIRSGPRTQTAPGSIGDNTKLVYLSPQFFGFDFGASFAPNSNEGADTGCIQNGPSYTCDRAYAFPGATTLGTRTNNTPLRLNEYQGMLRWRGSLAGIGLAASGGFIGSGAIKDMTIANGQASTLNGLEVWMAGLQATAYGFTVGAHYQQGKSNFFWQPVVKGDQDMSQIFAGGSYTAGPFTIGANYVFGTYAGAAGHTFNRNNGAITRNANATNGTQRRWGYGVGANYRLAPGLDLVAEYVGYRIAERGVDLDGIAAANNGIQDRIRADVFMLGTRLAF